MNIERAHWSSRPLERLAQPVFFVVPRSLAPANSLFPPRQQTLNVLDENRNGIVLAVNVVKATGTAEREGAIDLLKATVAPRKAKATLGVDKGYDAQSFIRDLRGMKICPHVALVNDPRRKKPSLDKRTTNSRGYQIRQVSRRQARCSRLASKRTPVAIIGQPFWPRH